jgi:hypothetical protein
MALGTFLFAGAVGVGTYALAKSKNASDGSAAMAGAAAGVGTMLVVPLLLGLLGWMIIIGLVSIPAAGVYFLMKSNDRRALPPGS